MTNASTVWQRLRHVVVVGAIPAAWVACSASATELAVANASRAAAVCPAGSHFDPGDPEFVVAEGWPLRSFNPVLAAMNEPALWCGEQPDSYRIVWLHSFNDRSAMAPPRPVGNEGIIWPPTSVRIVRIEGGWRVVGVQLPLATSREMLAKRERQLSEAEAQTVLAALDAFGVWRRARYSKNPDALDGASWLVEARIGPAYQPVVLVNADTDAIERLATVMLRLVNLDPEMLHRGMPLPPRGPMS